MCKKELQDFISRENVKYLLSALAPAFLVSAFLGLIYIKTSGMDLLSPSSSLLDVIKSRPILSTSSLTKPDVSEKSQNSILPRQAGSAHLLLLDDRFFLCNPISGSYIGTLPSLEGYSSELPLYYALINGSIYITNDVNDPKLSTLQNTDMACEPVTQ